MRTLLREKAIVSRNPAPPCAIGALWYLHSVGRSMRSMRKHGFALAVAAMTIVGGAAALAVESASPQKSSDPAQPAASAPKPAGTQGPDHSAPPAQPGEAHKTLAMSALPPPQPLPPGHVLGAAAGIVKAMQNAVAPNDVWTQAAG